MTMKTKKTLHRFAAVAAVLLAFCLVFMAPVSAADGTLYPVSSWTELTNAIGEINTAAAAAGGETVTAVINVEDAFDATISSDSNRIQIQKNAHVTLNLNGHPISITWNYQDQSQSQPDTANYSIIKIGSSASSNDDTDGASLIVNAGGENGQITLTKGESAGETNTNLFFVQANSKLFLNGGEYSAPTFIASSNGNWMVSSGTPQYPLYPNAQIYVNDAKLSSESTALFMPSPNGLILIEGNSEITGMDGIDIRAGYLVMLSGKVTAKRGTISDPALASQGSSETGAGITLAWDEAYVKPVNVLLVGGEITSTYNPGILNLMAQYPDSESYACILINKAASVKSVVSGTNAEPITLYGIDATVEQFKELFTTDKTEEEIDALITEIVEAGHILLYPGVDQSVMGESSEASHYVTWEGTADTGYQLTLMGDASSAPTYKLMDDIRITNTVEISSDVILDLNGKKIQKEAATASEPIFKVFDGANLVIKDSAGSGNIESNLVAVQVDDGHLTVDSGVTITGANHDTITTSAIKVIGSSTDAESYSTATINNGAKVVSLNGYSVGIYQSPDDTTKGYGAELTVSGKLTGGITVLGNIQPTSDNVPKITITGTADIAGTCSPAIYAAGYGTWEIAEGAQLTGDEALSIKSGQFTINGGTFTATGDYVDPASQWNNGPEATGASLSVTSNDAYAGNIEVIINGGEFISLNGHAVYEGIGYKECKQAGSHGDGHSCAQYGESTTFFVMENGEPVSASDDSHLQGISIINGKFTSASGKESVLLAKSDKTGFITGGTFSTAVSKYVAEGKICIKENDVFVVKDAPEEAIIPETPAVETTTTTNSDGSTTITITPAADSSTTFEKTGYDEVTISSSSATGNAVSIVISGLNVVGDVGDSLGSLSFSSENEITANYAESDADGEEGATVTLSLKIEDVNEPVPAIDTSIKEDILGENQPEHTVLAMITALGDDANENIKTGDYAITIKFKVPASAVTDKNMLRAYHVDNGVPEKLSNPLVSGPDNDGFYTITIYGESFSSYVLVEEEPQDNLGGGSAVDTGSGNYQYYPRSVPTDGIVDFGTSKVVTGMELPAGSDGTVTLNIKPTFAMPENGFYAFEIDAPGYNLDAKINGGLSFQIPVADLEAAGFTAEDIVLFHGTVAEDGKITWEALPTNLVKNENGVAYYKAAINSCSPFYIGFVKDGSVVNTEVVDPTVPETPEQPVTPDEPEVLPPVEEPTEEPETPASPAPILTVFAGLGAVVALRRK